ncbi:MAG: glycosyltransferase family 4 protein [Candidatus Sericytochromatia bacterium]|nr:glycosyltransferase family 4 protein [Candidatus Sericytochromatia bacterium]
MPTLTLISVSAPYGPQEAFVVREFAALQEAGAHLQILPLRPSGPLYHGRASQLAPVTEALPLLHPQALLSALYWLLQRPLCVASTLGILLAQSRTPLIAMKNLAVLPKACWIATRAQRAGSTHLHAQWAGTTTTAAWIASRLTDLPYSFTAHRWDIGEDNLLATKVRTAAFARTSDGAGAVELAAKAGPGAPTPWLLHLGVDLPPSPPTRPLPPVGQLRVLVPANLVPKKGHVVLFEALRDPALQGLDLHVTCAGDGPLRASLEEALLERGLQARVTLAGMWPLERLHAEMASGRYDAVVLPSIVTSDGETEGTPVSLVEALAHGMPVLASGIGGIPELLEDGCGLLVPPADPAALAAGLARLARDPDAARAMAEAGLARVSRDYEVEAVARALLARIDRPSNRPA